MMASIRPLPEAVRSSVRSGIFLFDFARVVEELVFNSLDARATKVAVFVSIGSCYVKVDDDGSGITRDGLELVGERYATSKILKLADLNATSENFGFRGEALASISEVSLLEIMTKTSGRPNGYQKALKGCKCLYLGIDDHRKEVGTTVVVRDLFYNQPVRRKYMQSSPNKVLQSIKKCVMRLALVRPNISFRVVDIEREDELFCTDSASPLSLVISGFGMEVTSSLLNLEVENDIIKLSGYISSPCNTLNMKVLQYVYVNSQFVCKGPIHKLLNQLSIGFEHQNSWNTDNEFQNKKKTKSQACPAYILNLSCPRSLYDLTFEPSKTYVKFKDWTPILNFIEKAIKQFWEDNIACAKLSNKAPYIPQEDQLPKVDVNIISGVPNISEFRNQNRKDCLDLFFSNSDKLIEDNYNQPNMEDVKTSLGYLHQETAMFKEQKSKEDFLCQTDNSGNLLDGSYAKCMSTVMRKHTSLLMYDNKDLLQENYFFDDKIPAAEKFYCNAPFDAPSSSHRRKFHEVETDVVSESFEDDLLYECNGFSSDIKISRELQKPFLKRCSSGEGSILHEKPLFVNDEHELQTDGFWSKQNLEEDYGSGKDLYSHSCPEVAKKLKMSKDSDFLERALAAENSLPPDSCYLATQIRSSRPDDQLLNSEWHLVFHEPSSQATALGVYHTADIKDDLGEISRHRRTHHAKLFYDRENECNFNYHTSRNANQHNCTTSFTNIGFHFDGAGDCGEIFTRSIDWPDFGDIYSTKRSDVLNKEIDWLLPESHVINCRRPNKNKGKRDHFRNSTSEENHERPRRSFSAPPFHRSKRRFFSLNHPSEMIAKRRTDQASNPAFNQEASDFKYPQQSPIALYPSSEDLFMQEFKTNVEKSSEVLGDTQVNDITKIDRFESFNIQNSAPFREVISEEVQDSGDYRTKWRNCSPEITNILANVQSQHNILDISSGFLHLAGDSLIPETINRKCLEDAKVLHQVDKKFIPVVAGRTLAVIDQHAADERIRLEELRQKVLSGEAKGITYLDAEQELVLPEIGYQLLYSYSEHIKDWGWICNIHAKKSESFRRNLDVLNRPLAVILVAVPCILGVNLNDVDLLEFLQQLADTNGSSTMPPSVIRVLNLKACRGAIMFGDSLLPSECSLLVEELKHTSLCFQCAHGRPTTVPLVNLEALHNQIANLGLMNERSNNEWHGLHRHKICIERAAQRLCSARGS